MRRREGAGQVAERLGVPMLYADAMSEEEQNWSDPWLLDSPARPAAEEAASSTPAFSHPLAADPRLWLRAAAGREDKRCVFCWRSRLLKTAEIAAAKGFDAFTTSLLYSRRQDHERIRMLGESVAAKKGIAFAYRDFRSDWQEGIRLSKEWGIYRQQYCGCLFSEYDRYRRDFSRLAGAETQG